MRTQSTLALSRVQYAAYLRVERKAAGGVARREIRARGIPRAAQHGALVRVELRGDAAVRAAPDRHRAAPVPGSDEHAVGAEAAPHGIARWAKAWVTQLRRSMIQKRC